MLFSELIQLLETMAVDDCFQFAVRIVAYHALVVEHHYLTVVLGIGTPIRQLVDIRIARLGKLRPHAAHDVSQMKVFFGGRRQFVFSMVQRVEAELQFMSMDAPIVHW